MRRTILIFLLKLNWYKPNHSRISTFKRNNDSAILKYLLKSGTYKTRPLAAKALAEIEDYTSIPLLLNAINDNIHIVSIAALNALEQLDITNENKKIVIRKRFYWAKLLNSNDKPTKKPKTKTNIYKWERSSKKSFEIVKELLKRPIR